MEEKRYSPSEFAKIVGEKPKPNKATLGIEGMVRACASDDNALDFAPFGCETWIAMPLSAITEIVDMGTRRCRDHVHRYARLTLTESDSFEYSLIRVLLETVSTQKWALSAIEADGGFNCAQACKICASHPWKTGPCSVCNSDECVGQSAYRQRGSRVEQEYDCELGCSERVAECLENCRSPACKASCMRRYARCMAACGG